jgi:hypothetical protein
MRIANSPKIPNTNQTKPRKDLVVGARAGADDDAELPPRIRDILPPALEKVAEAFYAATSASAQARRLVARILDFVPELKPDGLYLANWAARLVIVERRLPGEALDKLLSDVSAMRQAAAKRECGRSFHGGRFFNFKLQKLTAGLGIDWCPNGVSRQRE